MTVRQRLGAIFLAALLLLTGCAAILDRLPGIDSTHTVPIECIALYERVGPAEFVGHDGCGNYWKLEIDANGDSTCTLWDDDRGHLRIQCPAPEDSL